MAGADDLVSVIMPVHNGEQFIAAALDSVLAQTHRDLELIVVDDGSTDGTPAILAATARRDSRVQVIRGARAGVAAARNRAIEAARGALLAPIDADDIWHPAKIERQLAALRAGGAKAGAAYCWSLGIDENDVVIEQGQCESRASGDILEALAVSNVLGNASTPLLRRACVLAIGGYDPGLHAARAQGAEDWKLYLTLAEQCEFAVVPEYLVAYRRSAASMSTDTGAMRRSMKMVDDWLTERWPTIAARHGPRRTYFTYRYLADQALSRGRVVEALRHELVALWARPAMLVHPATAKILIRLAARLVGLRRPAWTKTQRRQLPKRVPDGTRWVPARPVADDDASGVGAVRMAL
jgi:glycosyltransferase involved in cell wall biosynthesis